MKTGKMVVYWGKFTEITKSVRTHRLQFKVEHKLFSGSTIDFYEELKKEIKNGKLLIGLFWDDKYLIRMYDSRK